MCGVAGSGKTTYAQRLEAAGYVRLSVDEEVRARFGRYGVDYDLDCYAEYSERVEVALRQRLHELIDQGRSVVADFSFRERRNRDRYKKLIEKAAGRWRLVYLKVPADVLSRRAWPSAAAASMQTQPFPSTSRPSLAISAGSRPSNEGEEVVTVLSKEAGADVQTPRLP